MTCKPSLEALLADLRDDYLPCRSLREAAANEIECLRACLAAIQKATIEGRVCDDVAWFDSITTLHDFCDLALNRPEVAISQD